MRLAVAHPERVGRRVLIRRVGRSRLTHRPGRSVFSTSSTTWQRQVHTLTPAGSAPVTHQVSVYLEAEGAAHYLPAHAGNLDIMTSAAPRVAEHVAAPSSEQESSGHSWTDPSGWIEGLTLGCTGVCSSFMRHAERASADYGVDTREILTEVGNRKLVGGHEGMIIDMATSSPLRVRNGLRS